MGVESDDEDYVELGTPREMAHADGPSRVREGAPGRFHGAFTGGFSAGFFNTVGSKEGFTPQQFKSSRTTRHVRNEHANDSSEGWRQSVMNFMDEDEVKELQRSSIAERGEFDTFGARRKATARHSSSSAHNKEMLLVPHELFNVEETSIGEKLLAMMRRARHKERSIKRNLKILETCEGAIYRKQVPKYDCFGLGYNEYVGHRTERGRTTERSLRVLGDDRGRSLGGAAFGLGVLEELGQEDEDVFGAGALPSAFEVVEGDDDEEEDDFGNRRSSLGLLSGVSKPGLVKQRGALLNNSQESRLGVGGAFVPLDDFVEGEKSESKTREWFAPPQVPPDFVERHAFSERDLSSSSSSYAINHLEEVSPPTSRGVRAAAEKLAIYVAKNGPQFESLAREKERDNPDFTFLNGGDGFHYYHWRRELAKIAEGGGLPPPEFNSDVQKRRLIHREKLPETQARGNVHERQGAVGPGDSLAGTVDLKVEKKDNAITIPPSLQSRFRVPGGGEQQQQNKSALVYAKGLATGLEDRFVLEGHERESPVSQPPASTSIKGTRRSVQTESRRVEEWRPNALLCKRFGVKNPFHAERTTHDPSSRMAKATALFGGQMMMTSADKTVSENPASSTHLISKEEGVSAGGARPEELAERFLNTILGGNNSRAQLQSHNDAKTEAILDKPLDLFKAIFDGDDASSEEDDSDADANGSPERNVAQRVTEKEEREEGGHEVKDAAAKNDAVPIKHPLSELLSELRDKASSKNERKERDKNHRERRRHKDRHKRHERKRKNKDKK